MQIMLLFFLAVLCFSCKQQEEVSDEKLQLQSVNAKADLVLHPHWPHGGPNWSTPAMKVEILKFFNDKLRGKGISNP